MNRKPLVTVYIPTFNRLDLLRRALDSVLEQSYRELEAIVVDDRSSDGTRQAVEEARRADPVRSTVRGRCDGMICWSVISSVPIGMAVNLLDDTQRVIELVRALGKANLPVTLRWHPRQKRAQVAALEHNGYEERAAHDSATRYYSSTYGTPWFGREGELAGKILLTLSDPDRYRDMPGYAGIWPATGNVCGDTL